MGKEASCLFPNYGDHVEFSSFFSPFLVQPSHMPRGTSRKRALSVLQESTV